MWIHDDEGEPLWDEEDEREPTEQEIVDKFFEENRLETVFGRDLGYDCSIDITLEEMYQMFKLRMKLENENDGG
jgi:hypothetical protein